MGAADSKEQPDQAVDQITTVSKTQAEELDPCLERLQSLKVVGPLLRAPSSESGLKEILLEQAASAVQSSIEDASLDATATAELFALYREWQRENAKTLSKRQEDLGFRIEAVEALALKLLQRLTHSSTVMKTTASHLEEVEKLQKEVKDMKQILGSALHGYESLCKNINEVGPDFLKSSARPFQLKDVNALG